MVKLSKITPTLRFFKDNSQSKKIEIIRPNDEVVKVNDVVNYFERKESEPSQTKNSGQNPAIKFSLRGLIDELLEDFLGDKNIKDYLLFENNDQEIIKPSFLYTVNQNGYLQNDSIVNNHVYKLLRIHEDSKVLNETYDFETLIPDVRTRMFFLQEGAFVIESENNRSQHNNSLEKKYYMAFLFALNQRLLFQYFQKKINELTIDDDGYFIPRELRRLKSMLIKGDFAQVFSSISNYHEIDFFYENLRKIFKILQLREEFITSVESIEKIASLAEERERLQLEKDLEAKRQNELRLQFIKEKKRDESIAFIATFLAIGQAYSGISQSIIDPLITSFYFEIILHSVIYIVISIFIIVYSIKLFSVKLDKFDKSEHDKK